jgi:hypothetical protein
MPARETSNSVRGVKVRLFTAGEGAPLIFLHGAGGIERWLPFFDLLAARLPDYPANKIAGLLPWNWRAARLAVAA